MSGRDRKPEAASASAGPPYPSSAESERARRPSVRLVIVEDGTNSLVEQVPGDAEHQTVVVVQSGGERPLDFGKRVLRRISAFEHDGRCIARTLLLLSPRFDADATAARLSLTRALISHAGAPAAGASELVLNAGADLHEDLQSKVEALVDSLTHESSGASLPIRAQFGSRAV